MANVTAYREVLWSNGVPTARDFNAFLDENNQWRSTIAGKSNQARFQVWVDSPSDLTFKLSDTAAEGEWFRLDEIVAQDGLADGWLPNARQYNSKVSGNGFVGTAQRVEYALQESLDWISSNNTETGNPFQYPGIIQEGKCTQDSDYIVSMRYRASRPIQIDLAGGLYTAPANTQTATTLHAYVRSGTVGTDFKVYMSGSGQDWFEIDTVELKEYNLVKFSDLDTKFDEVVPCTISGSNFLLTRELTSAGVQRAIVLYRFTESGQIIKRAEFLSSTNRVHWAVSQNTGFCFDSLNRMWAFHLTTESFSTYEIVLTGAVSTWPDVIANQAMVWGTSHFLYVFTSNHVYINLVSSTGVLSTLHDFAYDGTLKDAFVKDVDGKMICFLIGTDNQLSVVDLSVADSPVYTGSLTVEDYDNVEPSDEVLSLYSTDTVYFYSLALEPVFLFSLPISAEIREVRDQYMFTFNPDTSSLDAYLALSSVGGISYTDTLDVNLSVPYHNFTSYDDPRFVSFPVMYDVDRGVPTVYGYESLSTSRGRKVISNLRNCFTNISEGSSEGTLVSSKYMNNLLRNSVVWLLHIDPSYLSTNQVEVTDTPDLIPYEPSPHVKLLDPTSMTLQTDMDFTGNIEEILSKASGITIPSKFLPSIIQNDLTFENKTVRVTYDTGGLKPIARFGGILGDSQDIAGWWRYVDSVGEETGQYIHNLLDKRVERTGEPLLSDLQSEINPAKFLLSHVLSKGTILILVDDTVENRRLVKDIDFRNINKVLPLNTAVIVLYTNG